MQACYRTVPVLHRPRQLVQGTQQLLKRMMGPALAGVRLLTSSFRFCIHRWCAPAAATSTNTSSAAAMPASCECNAAVAAPGAADSGAGSLDWLTFARRWPSHRQGGCKHAEPAKVGMHGLVLQALSSLNTTLCVPYLCAYCQPWPDFRTTLDPLPQTSWTSTKAAKLAEDVSGCVNLC
jgi:hypothetical protein